MIVVGIDPSLTSCGIAILRDGRPILLTSVGHKGRDGDDYAHRSRRIVSQCRAVMAIVDQRCGHGACNVGKCACDIRPAPDLAVIEGPAWAMNLPSSHDRAGLWWGIYSALSAKRIPIAVVTPTCRAKWATGAGRAKKAQVLEHVRATWSDYAAQIRNDDIADALTLAEIGARWLGEPLPFEARRRHVEGLGAVAWPEGVRA